MRKSGRGALRVTLHETRTTIFQMHFTSGVRQSFMLPGLFVSARERALDRLRGAVAQLGERLNGIQEVDGSTPFSSTLLVRGGSHASMADVTGAGRLVCASLAR